MQTASELCTAGTKEFSGHCAGEHAPRTAASQMGQNAEHLETMGVLKTMHKDVDRLVRDCKPCHIKTLCPLPLQI